MTEDQTPAERYDADVEPCGWHHRTLSLDEARAAGLAPAPQATTQPEADQ